MTRRPQSPRLPEGAAPAAGEATTRPGIPCDACQHLDVFHGLAGDRRTRTACSTSTGPEAIPCGCRRYTPPNQEANAS